MNSDRPHLLIVDDEHFILNALRLYFESHDFDVSAASDGDQASEIFAQKHKAIDVAILDLVMPGTHGLELLRSFKEIAPDVQVIIATGCGSMGSAVEALRLGAFDFITKPILDFDTDLMRSVRNALEVRRSPEIPADPEPASSEDHWFQVYETLNQFAATYIGKPPTPKVLHETWKLLNTGFQADAAILIDQRSEEEWEPLFAWGLSQEPRGVEWREQVVEIFGPTEGLAESDLSLEGTPWKRSFPIDLRLADQSSRVLLLLYEDEDREPEAGPVALLMTILSPILCQVASENQLGAGLPRGVAESRARKLARSRSL